MFFNIYTDSADKSYFEMLFLFKPFSSPKNIMQIQQRVVNPTGNYMFKVDNNTRTRCEICSKLTAKTPERRHWRCSGVFLLILKTFHTLFWCFYCQF